MTHGRGPRFLQFSFVIIDFTPIFVLLMWQHMSHDTISSLFALQLYYEHSLGTHGSIDDRFAHYLRLGFRIFNFSHKKFRHLILGKKGQIDQCVCFHYSGRIV